MEAGLDQLEHGNREIGPAVEENEINRVWQGVQRVPGVAGAQVDQIRHPGRGEVGARCFRLIGLESGTDDRATAVVPDRTGEVNCRDAERSSVFDDGSRAYR